MSMITKPLAMEHLAARIRGMLERCAHKHGLVAYRAFG